ncbi:hypothetical protein M5689_017076 [Euphorbia peplus]|nr:hypothetical protein M5689_017076 [Euphorbia peplus]
MGGTNEYPEELKHLGLAALTIVSFKQAKIDASTIDELKRKLVHGTRDSNKHRKVSHTPRVSSMIELTDKSLFWRYEPLKNMKESLWRAICSHTPSDIPPVQRLHGLIGSCSKPFEKQLTNSDIKEDQNRLAMNKTDVEKCILPLLNKDEDPEEEIRVTTYDQEGSEFEMVYKKWSSKYHVLIKGWKQFFLKHKLEMHQDFVTLWMFRNRYTNKLCFVITWRRLPIYHPLKRKRNK